MSKVPLIGARFAHTLGWILRGSAQLGRIGFSTATLYLLALPHLHAQANQQPAPTVFVEGFRAKDTLSREVAASLREALAKSVSPTRLVVLSTAQIDTFRNLGQPDDFFGDHWSWSDVKESANYYRATCVVDLLATRASGRITITVARLRAPFKGNPETLEPVSAPTVDSAVAILAQRLASDSALFTAWVTPPFPPPAPVDSSRLGGYRVRVKDSESGTFLAMYYVLLTPPNSTTYANMRTTSSPDGWGPTRYDYAGKYAIELDALVCGTMDWELQNKLRKSFAIKRGGLTSIEFVVRKSALRMAKAYYNPTGRPCDP